MTGYGRAEKTGGNWRCGVELRSVNSRFLEIRIKMPNGLFHLEERLRKLIKTRCARGKLDCTITLAPQSQEASPLGLNKTLLRQYGQLLRAFQEELGTEVQVTLGNLANIKDMIFTDQWVEDATEVEGLLAETVDEAVGEMIAMREREGEALLAELKERFAGIRTITEEIASLTKEIPAHHAKRLRDNLQRLMGPQVPDEERIFQEIAILSDRCDVTEEISRIETHLGHLEQMLSQGGALGRKVDFLLQEINREANTLATKSSEVPVSTRVVEIKSELEKLREQIQNIE
jgi:uncharacterized protein (TIGR00255 family)